MLIGDVAVAVAYVCVDGFPQPQMGGPGECCVFLGVRVRVIY